jgi:hypothetical protein
MWIESLFFLGESGSVDERRNEKEAPAIFVSIAAKDFKLTVNAADSTVRPHSI